LEQSPGVRQLHTSYPSISHDRLLHPVEVQGCASQTRGKEQWLSVEMAATNFAKAATEAK